MHRPGAGCRDERAGRAAEPIEIFDAHLHYNWEPKPYYQLDEVLALFKKHRVTGILATSRPNTGTHALMDAKPEGLQVVPFIRPYRVRADIQTWFGDPVSSTSCRTNSNAAITAASANFTSSGKSAENEWVKKTVDFAVANDLYLHAHADDEAVEILMRHNPKARIIWAHTGFGLSTDRVSAMLSKYPKLWGELSYRGGIIDGRRKADAGMARPVRALSRSFPARLRHLDQRALGELRRHHGRLPRLARRSYRRRSPRRSRTAMRGRCSPPAAERQLNPRTEFCLRG